MPERDFNGLTDTLIQLNSQMVTRMAIPSGFLSSSNTEYSHIENWSYTPKEYQFYKINDEDELYLGCEIEVDNGGVSPQAAKKIREIINSSEEVAYIKRDGSLTNGFEIVTHPCTYQFHKERIKYQEIFKELISIGYRAHDTTTCGLHVHINRSYFGKYKLDQDLSISKLLYLIEKFWDKVVLIARRDSNRYAQRFRMEDDDTPLDMYAKSKNSNKYGAVNLSHKDTVEIRIFKGTLNYNTFICTLEFVKLIAEFAKSTDIYYIQGVVWDDILHECSDDLVNYITEREEKFIEKIAEKKQNESLSISTGGLFASSSVTPNSPSGFYPSGMVLDHSEFHPELFQLLVETGNNSNECNSEELLRKKIKRIKKMIKRSRNELERLSLRRDLALEERNLRELRLSQNR